MIIQTTRFGQVQIEDQDILPFPEGVLGFADLKNFVLLDDPSDDIFAWLQSCDEPAIAFPVLEPEIFKDKYQVVLTRTDMEAIHLLKMEDAKIFCIVTIPEDVSLMTANIKAPIVINLKNRHSRQCVLSDNALAIREPIFASLQARVISNPSVSIKGLSKGLNEVAVRLSESEADALAAAASGATRGSGSTSEADL